MGNIQNSSDLDLLKLKYGSIDKIPDDVLLKLKNKGNAPNNPNVLLSEPMQPEEPKLQNKTDNVQRFLNKYSSGNLGFIPPIVAEKYQGAKEEGLPFIGETIYDIASSKLPPSANAAMTGLGRATGEATNQIIQGFLNNPNAPKSEKEALMRIVSQFGVGAGSQYASTKLFNAIGRVGAALGAKSAPLKPYPNLNELEPIAKKAGIKFTPAERTVSRPIDTLETVAENALFGRGTIRDIKEIQHPAGVRRMTQQLLDEILPSGGKLIRTSTGEIKPLSKVEVGSMVNDLVNQRNKQFKDIASALYKNVDKKAGDIVTDISYTKQFAQQIKKQRIKENAPKAAIDDILENILNRPDKVDFRTAHNIRSDFLEIERNAPSTKDRVAGIAKKAAGLIDAKVQKQLQTSKPEAYTAWRSANSFYKNGKEVFNSELMRKIAKSMENGTPEDVVDVIFKGKSPSQISMIMNMIEPSKSGKYSDNMLKRRLRYTFLQDAINKNSRQIPGDVTDSRTVIGKNLIDFLDSNYGDDVLKEIFPPKELKNIKNVARIAKITQGKTGGAGGFLIQLIQAGPMAGVAGGVVTGTPELTKKSAVTALPIGGFTYGLAKLMASDNGSKLLTDIMITPPNTKQYFNLMTRISREMLLNELNDKKEYSQSKEPNITKNNLKGFGGRGY